MVNNLTNTVNALFEGGVSTYLEIPSSYLFLAFTRVQDFRSFAPASTSVHPMIG